MNNFTVLMTNRWSTSACSAPDVPTEPKPDETLVVEREGELLKIAAVKAEDEFIQARIFARLFLERDGTAVFSVLPTLPRGVVDAKFFPATGTAILFEEGGKRRLKAVGTDTNSGECGGWIFDATENG